jgi:hypothetical protein
VLYGRRRLDVRKRMLAVVPIAAAVLMLTAQMASATQINDPKDTGGKLDISTVNATRTGGLEVAVSMYGTWPSTLLAHSGPNRIQLLFDTDNDGVAEYVGNIFDLNGHLEMVIKGQGSTFEPLSVSRPDDNTALVTIPASSPPNPSHKYQFAVRARFQPASGPEKVDRAPNHGWMVIPHS